MWYNGKIMKTFQYWNFSEGFLNKTLITEIDAESIGQADKILTEKLQAEWQLYLSPVKVAWIHVNIK
jgi:hypothetical protein